MLHLHRSERADGLLGALGDVLAEPLEDPFASEVVAVPTRGVERWLTQQLSLRLGARPGRSDGVLARVDFPSLPRLVEDAVVQALGLDPDADPWRPERMVWPLLDVVAGALEEPWLAALAGHLGAAEDAAGRARRFGAVRHIAGLFDRYALHRPEMVRAWAVGDEVDGRGAPLGDEALWQPRLWALLRARLAVPGPAERLEQAAALMAAEPGRLTLPPRLSLFGLTRLPAARLRALRAIAEARDVHLLVLHPSPALWSEIAGTSFSGLRSEDPTAEAPRNRLLASWGRDARELQLVVGEVGADRHHPPAAPPVALLGRLQADVRADAPPDGSHAWSPEDRSVEVHACHGRGRQVEVLRDAVLRMLDADPALEPRDVVVMCPDIETFAPLIQATFGTGEVADEEDAPADGRRPPGLRVRLADRALRQTNPVLGAIGALLELADGRVTASQVLDLADREPVRRAFGFDDDEIARLEEWIAASGIRWGLDAAHRAPFKLDKVEANSWDAGLKRVLLGVAMTEEDGTLLDGVLPLDDVDSGAIDLAGRFAELVDRLHAIVDELLVAKPIAAWAEAIARAADLTTATSDRDAWQRGELDRLLGDVASDAAVGRSAAAPLSLAEVRTLLAPLLAGRPTRANFRTGHLTICTLMPMRSVPHRVVCLLGLDDAVFPRKAPRDGDDLVLGAPRVGDHDGRTEDRQLLLDALLAAEEKLLVTYSGNDERTNAERPPAVPIGELLDAIEATAPDADVVVRHPLQPFHPRNFDGATLPRSYDAVMLDGARALVRGAHPPGPFLAGPLPPLDGDLVELDALVRFVEFPVRAFLRARLDVRLGDRSGEVDDGFPVELDALEQWGVGERILAARLRGVPIEEAEAAERARGTLPPGTLARGLLRDVRSNVEQIVAKAGDVGTLRSVDVRVALPDGRVLGGTVAGVDATTLRTTTYSRLGPRHRISAWVRLLALSACHAGEGYSAMTVGRARFGRGAQAAAIAPQDDVMALQRLGEIVALYDEGMRRPAPMAVRTSFAFAEAAHLGRDTAFAAEKEWATGFGPWDKEDRAPEHVLAFGGELSVAELLARPGFADSARSLWQPLIDEENLR